MLRKLIMLSSHPGSPDGRRVQWYIEGKTYEFTESLAAIFLKEGWAAEDPAELPAAELPAAETPKAELSPARKQEYAAPVTATATEPAPARRRR